MMRALLRILRISAVQASLILVLLAAPRVLAQEGAERGGLSPAAPGAQSPYPEISAYLWGPWDPTGAVDAERRLIALIDSAEQSLDIAAYGCGLESMHEALVRAASRGVELRIALDQGQCNVPAWNQLPGARLVTNGHGEYMHDKIVVVDGRWVWTGSANFTTRSFGQGASSAENAVVITSTHFAAAFQHPIRHMHATGTSGTAIPTSPATRFTVGATTIDAWFSPQDHPRDRIVAVLNEATETIRIAMNWFTEDDLADTVVAAGKRGVDVAVILDDGTAQQEVSALPTLCAGYVPVFEDQFNGVLHHKFAAIDAHGAAPRVLTGSANWSKNAMTHNDENVLLIGNAEIAAQYHVEWQRIRTRSRNVCTPNPAPTETAAPTYTATRMPTATPTASPSATLTPTPTATRNPTAIPRPIYLPRLLYRDPSLAQLSSRASIH